jgi:hypothetical protein
MRSEKERFEASPALQAMVREYTREAILSQETEDMKESDLLLSAPDEYLRRMF